MRNKPRKIIIDTNVFISFLITRNNTQLDEILFSKEWKLIFSIELIKELIEVSRRTKFRRFFSVADIENLLTLIYNQGKFIIVQTEVAICRDPKDNFLLALATDGEAEFLITGDQDLLVIGKHENTNITSISDFLKIK